MTKNSVALLSSALVSLLAGACGSDSKSTTPDAAAVIADAPEAAFDSKVIVDGTLAIDSAPIVQPDAAAPAPITLFASQFQIGGTIGGRDGADMVCMESAGSLTCPVGVHALISVDANDQLKDIPTNFSLPVDVAITTATGVMVATRWADLIDGSIDNSLEDAGLFPPDSQSNYWTGSSSDGSVSATCQNWTSSDPTDTGEVGTSGATDVTWMDDGGLICNSTSEILCLCY